MSQSSSSTNIDDLDMNFLQEDDNSRFLNAEDLYLNSTPSTYGLRSRTVQKFDWKKLKRRKADRNKSQSDVSKVAEESDSGMVCEETVNDPASQESVSMLRGCYQEETRWNDEFPELLEIEETGLNSTLEFEDGIDDEVREGWTVKEVPQPSSRSGKVEQSTQTNFSIFRENKMAAKDEEARNHAGFVGSIINLKATLSDKKEVSTKTFWNVLKHISSPSSSEDGSDVINQTKDSWDGRREETVHTETIGYLLRTTNTEKVFIHTVKALLTYLEQALDRDLDRIAFCWKNSVYEMAVEMINQAVEREPGIRKMVDSFLYRILGSILNNDGKLKNLALESKTMFLINFCQSTYLRYDVINYIIDRLKSIIVESSGGRSTLEERLNQTRLTNNSYFLFRILETELVCFKRNLEEREEVEELVGQESESKNFNVLEMWKKHWRQEEGVKETERAQHSFKMTVNKWCDELDSVLLHCVKHVPICSLVGERCGRLAKDLLKLCHPEVMGMSRPKEPD